MKLTSKIILLLLFISCFSCEKYEMKPEHKELNDTTDFIVQLLPKYENSKLNLIGFFKDKELKEGEKIYVVIENSAFSDNDGSNDERYKIPLSKTYIETFEGKYNNEIKFSTQEIENNKIYKIYFGLLKNRAIETLSGGYVPIAFDKKSNSYYVYLNNNNLMIVEKDFDLDNNNNTNDTTNTDIGISFSIKPISNIKHNTADLNLNISEIGTSSVSEFGFIISTNSDLSNFETKKISKSFSKGDFALPVDNLSPNTQYYVVGYIKTATDTYLTSKVSFKTNTIELAKVTTLNTSDLAHNSVHFNATLNDLGISAISKLGFVYATDNSPEIIKSNEIEVSFTTATKGMPFDHQLNGLVPNTTYYVRAFAINKEGVVYGDVVAFTTKTAPLAKVTTLAISDLTYSSVHFNATLNDLGISAISKLGFVYATHNNPKIRNDNEIEFNFTNTTEGMSFDSQLNELIPNTTYYVRAFAINSEGIGYGDVVSFTTKDNRIVFGTGVATQDFLIPGHYLKEQFIITSQELADKGITSENLLKSLAIKIGEVRVPKYGHTSLNDVSISIGHTSQSSFGNTNFITNGLTKVYSSYRDFLYPSSNGQWKEFLFSSDFQYDGNSDIVIEIYAKVGDASMVTIGIPPIVTIEYSSHSENLDLYAISKSDVKNDPTGIQSTFRPLVRLSIK